MRLHGISFSRTPDAPSRLLTQISYMGAQAGLACGLFAYGHRDTDQKYWDTDSGVSPQLSTTNDLSPAATARCQNTNHSVEEPPPVG